MFQKFVRFVKYNNAFSLIVMLIFSGTTTTFAASETARASVYASSETMVSVDNRYLLSQNIAAFSFDMKILAIREDQDYYYVDYSYKTLEVEKYVWKEVLKPSQIKISRKSLEGKDLGLHLAQQLGEIIDANRRDLLSVQSDERAKGATYQTAVVVYSGLVGQLLDSETKDFPGYVPVVETITPAEQKEYLAAYLKEYGTLEEASRAGEEAARALEEAAEREAEELARQVQRSLDNPTPVPTPTPPVEEAPVETPDTAMLIDAIPVELTSVVPETTTADQTASASVDTQAPVITLIGSASIEIPVGSTWIDLGATVTDNVNENLGIQVEGAIIDTREPAEFVVTYNATDGAGNKATQITRTVRVIPDGTVQVTEPLPEVTPVIVPEIVVVPEVTPAEETPAPAPEVAPVPEVVPPPAEPVTESTPEPVVTPAEETPAPAPEVAPVPEVVPPLVEPAAESTPEPVVTPAEATPAPAVEEAPAPASEPAPEVAPVPEVVTDPAL